MKWNSGNVLRALHLSGAKWSRSFIDLLTYLAALASFSVLFASCGGGSVVTTPTVCNPLSFGAVGDGTTDNTDAIQSAVNSCAMRGGGIVELSAAGENAVYV